MLLAFFGFNRRLGRGGWWAGQGLLLVGVIGLVISPQLLGEPTSFIISSDMKASDVPKMPTLWETRNLLIFGIAYTWIFMATTANRFHDLGRSGLWSLFGLLPPALHLLNTLDCAFCGAKSGIEILPVLVMVAPTIVSFALMGYCGTTPGDIGDNKWGPPPGSGSRRYAEIDEWDTKPGQNFAKLDDAYFADYAQKLAEQVAVRQAVKSSVQTGASSAGAAARPGFGKR